MGRPSVARMNCIAHQKDQPMIVIYADQLAACDGHHCTAALLNVFEYWHSVRLSQIQQERKRASTEQDYQPNLSTWIYKNIQDLSDDIIGMFGETSISKSVVTLLEKGFIESKQNTTNPFDRTKMYRLNTARVQEAINSFDAGPLEDVGPRDRDRKNTEWTPQNRPLSLEETTENGDYIESPLAPKIETSNSSDVIDEITLFRIWNQIKGLKKPSRGDRAKVSELSVGLKMTEDQLYASLQRFSAWLKTTTGITSPILAFLKKAYSWMPEDSEPVFSAQPYDTPCAQPASILATSVVVERDYAAEWNAIVTSCPVEWDARRSPVGLLRECAADEVFGQRFTEACTIAQKIHASGNGKNGWPSFKWAITRKADGYGWWRLLNDLRGMSESGQTFQRSGGVANQAMWDELLKRKPKGD